MTQKQAIKQHFRWRMFDRYNIRAGRNELQKAMRKRLKQKDKFCTILLQRYNSHKCKYATQYQGQRIVFVYDHRVGLAKTCLS